MTGEGPVVATAHGPVRGVRDGGVDTFLAVPYAAPSLGDLRFRPPQLPAPWSAVRDCTQRGTTAPQPVLPAGLFPQTIVEGDDYLHVNVHTPSVEGSAPVLVWIHGGGMVMGSNADVDGRALARRGIVVVAVNYRLGCDGFLCLDDAPPNRGVRDWIAALQWVQDNIAQFGGDPGNVTIGGQSAGSAACLTLLTVPGAEGLFRRVLAMSGSPWNLVDEDTARRYGDDLARRLGVPRTTAGIAAVPVDRLLAAQHEVAPVGGIGGTTDPLALFGHVATLDGWLGPVVDGDLLPVHPLAAVATGAGGAAEVVLGSTAQETDALFTFFGASLTPDDASHALADLGLDPAAVSAWLASHPERAPGQALGVALTALSFRVPALVLAEARAAVRATAPTYVYEVAWCPPTPMGAVHGFDLAFAFDTIDVEWAAMLSGGAPPPSLASDMAGAVVRFVGHGDPGWPAYDPAGRCEMAFDVPSRVRSDPDRETRELFTPLRRARNER